MTEEFENVGVEHLGSLSVGDKGLIVFNSGGMGEEVADEDMFADVVWQFGKPMPDGVLDGKTFVLFKEEDAHGRKLLGDGGHAKVGGFVEWGDLSGARICVEPGVGPADGVLIEDHTVALYGDGDARLVGWERMEERVEAGGQGRLGGGLDGRD